MFSAAIAMAAPGQRAIETDSQGRKHYWVLLNEGSVNAQTEEGERPSRQTMDPENVRDFRGRHKPKVRKLVKKIEAAYGVEALSMTSYIAPTFAFFASDQTIARMHQDPDIKEVNPVWEDKGRLSAWSNQPGPGTELIPWGRFATGTSNSSSYSGTVIYQIDARGAVHNDYNMTVVPVPPVPFNYVTSVAEQAHAMHVAGILAGHLNGSDIQGIAPSATIKNVAIFNRSIPAYQAAMDWVLQDAETTAPFGIFAVANISSNYGEFSTGGALNPWVRRLSSRLLVVQSAGNLGQHDTFEAYTPASPHDGILVVGGTDENGAAALSFDNSLVPGFGLQPNGSTYGPNVEVWAPSQRVTSTWNGPSTQVLSGTSMAAPHIAALAARYGNIYTTPVQREAYIRAKLFFTGYYDRSFPGLPIYMASEAQPLAFSTPNKLMVQSVTADSTYSGDVYNLFDGKYLYDNWNSGHYAPAWVHMDLGQAHALSSIRLTPESFTIGNNFRYEIYAGNSPYPGTLVATITANGNDYATVSAGLNGVSARYVWAWVAQCPDWVAFKEIELYGF
jgi:hypothetical protein